MAERDEGSRLGTGAFIGGSVASEWIVAFRTVDPVRTSAIIPAIGGALLVDAIVRYTTRGSCIHHAPVA